MGVYRCGNDEHFDEDFMVTDQHRIRRQVVNMDDEPQLTISDLARAS